MRWAQEVWPGPGQPLWRQLRRPRKVEAPLPGVRSAGPRHLAALRGAEMAACLPGVHYVFDTSFSRNFSLLESQREFVRRFRGQADSRQALPVLTSACPGAFTLPCWVTGPLVRPPPRGSCARATWGHLVPQDRDLTDARRTGQ